MLKSRRFENKKSNCSQVHTEVIHCKTGKINFENRAGRIPVQDRTAKAVGELIIALDFAVSISCSEFKAKLFYIDSLWK